MAVTVAVAAGLLGGLSAALTVTTAAATADAVTALDGAAGAVRVQARVQQDAEAQTAAMRSAIEARFGPEAVSVDRLLQAASVPIGIDGDEGDAAALDLLAGEAPADAVRIVDGAPAVAPDELALHALAAEQLGLAIGDTVVLEPTGVALTVAGTWLPRDPADPLWFGDPLVAAGALDAGASEQRFGPAIVAERALDGLDPRPYATFILRPSAGLADPPSLGAVRDALDGLDDALRDDPIAGRGGVIVDGRLGASLDGILRSLTAVSAVAPVPQLVVAVVAALALLPVVRLVVASREGESLLLRARGGSTTALLRRTAAEALVVAVLPAGLVATVIAGVVLLTGGGIADAGPIALRAAALAVLVGLLTGILLLALTAWSTRRAGGRLGAGLLAAGRGAPAVSGIGIAIVVAAAALSVAQLRRSGTPLASDAGGELVVEPLAVLAPVLALLAVSLVAGALFPLIVGAVAGAARRRRGLGPVLVGRALARLGAVFAVPVLLVSLATGTAVVAAAYDASWSRGDALASALRDGAAARVQLPAQPALPSRIAAPTVDLAPVAALDGVAAVELAAVRTADLLDEGAGIVGVAASRLGAVSALPAARSAVIAQAIAPGGGDGGALPGIPLPEGVTGVAIAVDEAAEGADTPEVAAWVVEAEGAVQRLRSGDALAPGAWTLVGIDIVLPLGEPAQRVERTARLTGLTAITPQGEEALALPDDWVLAPVTSARPAIGAGGLEDALTIDTGEGAIALTAVTEFVAPEIAARLVDPAALDPVPAAVSRALADRVDRGVGDEVALGFAGSGRELSATIEAVVDAVPAATASAAMIVDLAAMTTQLIATSSVVPPAEQVWIAAEPAADAADPAALAEAAAGLLAGTALPSGADRALVVPARDALQWGAVGAALLAVLGVAVAAAVRAAGAEREVVALRALGLSPRRQARLRVGELAAAVVVAAAFGLLGGATVAALVVPALAGAAIPPLAGAIEVPLALDPLALGAQLAGAGLLVGLVLAWTAAVVRRRARVAVPRELGA